MPVLVEEWQKAIAKVPGDWIVETAGFNLLSANSPDGEDRMCVGWNIDRETGEGPIEVVHLVRYLPIGEGRKPEYMRVEFWSQGGTIVGDEQTWNVWLARTRWHWWVAADGDHSETTGVCMTRCDAVSAAYRVRWDRLMEPLRARARALQSPN